MGVKGTIIKILEQGNLQLQARVDVLEKRDVDQECYLNNMDQYIRRNNIEVQCIPKTVKDDELESKFVDAFGALNTNVSNKNIEGCHRTGKDDKNTILRFVNKTYCCKAMSKKMDLKRLDNSSLAFQLYVKLYFSENLTPYN